MNSNREIHNVLIARCGQFVGLYRIDKEGCLRLWRKLNKSKYKLKYVGMPADKPQEYGYGGYLGVSGKWDGFNEIHVIPKKYNVHDMGHMKQLCKLLGGAYSQVYKRIRDFNPISGGCIDE